ncbi:hypothetical protein F2P81_019763 [Scophthalmus maximus]|uniref:Uncharacterized protein n=1 Tax=Scophthalmus maximus TaxID=52904 RepID=A0A6A4S734_SCOMX|nr:hypothetical protein F2P81_019763 [Scophthalmus maximus]
MIGRAKSCGEGRAKQLMLINCFKHQFLSAEFRKLIDIIHSYVIVKSKGILAAPNNTAAKSGILTKCFDEKAMFIGIIMP